MMFGLVFMKCWLLNVGLGVAGWSSQGGQALFQLYIYTSYIHTYIHTYIHIYIIYVCKHTGFSPIWVKFGCQSSESSSPIWSLKSGFFTWVQNVLGEFCRHVRSPFFFTGHDMLMQISAGGAFCDCNCCIFVLPKCFLEPVD